MWEDSRDQTDDEEVAAKETKDASVDLPAPKRVQHVSSVQKLLHKFPHVRGITRLQELDNEMIEQLISLCDKSFWAKIWRSLVYGHNFVLNNPWLFPNTLDTLRSIYYHDYTYGGVYPLYNLIMPDYALRFSTYEALAKYIRDVPEREMTHRQLLIFLDHMAYPSGLGHHIKWLKITEIINNECGNGENGCLPALERAMIRTSAEAVVKLFQRLPGYEYLLFVNATLDKFADLVQNSNTISEFLEKAKGLVSKIVLTSHSLNPAIDKVCESFYPIKDCGGILEDISDYSDVEFQAIVKNIHRKHQVQLLSMGKTFADLLVPDEQPKPQPVLEWLQSEVGKFAPGIKQGLKTEFPDEWEQLTRLVANPETPISDIAMDGLVNALFADRVNLYWKLNGLERSERLFKLLISHGVIGGNIKIQLTVLRDITDLNHNFDIDQLVADYERRKYAPEQLQCILSVSSLIHRSNMDAIYFYPLLFDGLGITEAYMKDPVEAMKKYRSTLRGALDNWEPADEAKSRLQKFLECGHQFHLNQSAQYDPQQLNRLMNRRGKSSRPTISSSQ